MIRFLTLAAVGAALTLAGCATSMPSLDDRTADWWRTTGDLSGDDMEGRDTGSAGYDRAAAYVADRFARAGLSPAGDNGGWFQQISFDEIAVDESGTRLEVAWDDGTRRDLRFQHDVSVTPTWGTPEQIDAPLVFRGYCAGPDMMEVAGKVVICFGARRAGQTTGAGRLQAATAAGAVAMINVDDIGFILEPPRWPVAYARTVVIADGSARPQTIPVLRLSAEAFVDLAASVGQDGAALLDQGGRGEAMASFDLPGRLRARFAMRERSYTSANVLGVLPGTDPDLADEPVLLTAHLDGYGYGTPVNGDGLYNGALDDAAYVATLMTLADERAGRGYRRPVIFAALTGEEKGLWGARWLQAHPTLGAPVPVAVLNLDQLRPLYPLTILTTIGLDDSSLGQTTRDIAGPMGIQVRPDLEPERNLLRRTDHWPFMQAGVPSISFLFGFDPGTEAGARYRDWYQNRYHAPQDDLSTPIDFQAQADFHTFWFALVEAVANADAPPSWSPDSPLRPSN